MTTEIKKGSEVWSLCYEGGATVSVKRLVVESFGKHHGTARQASNGLMTKHHLSPKLVGWQIFNVLDIEDINAFALQYVKDLQQMMIKRAVGAEDRERLIACTPTVIFK